MSGQNQTRWPRQLSWKEMPMLRLLLPLLLGITLGIFIPGLPLLLLGIGLSLGAVGCGLLTRRKIPYRLRHGYAFFCFLFWINAGSWLSLHHLAINCPNYFQRQHTSEAVWLGKVRDASSSSFPRAVIDMQGYWGPDKVSHPVKGKLLVYPEHPLEAGQIITFQCEFQPIPPKKNPMDFDHRRYRFFQNIHHQAYLKEAQYQVLRKEPPQRLEAWRNKQIADWKAQLKDPAVYSVATAMVLGYKEELPEEVRTMYAQTGASHVLAVSGLHVGLIYLLLTGLLRKGNTRKVIRIINTLLCLAGIWGFALLTGATPSVVRASTMFSFILVGKQLGRGISIFNSIAASAFLLLLINPFWLFHIGFQLSYLAVLGIVVFQPRWYQLWIPPNRLVDKIWTLITVSLAAQLATVPLTLYYFHQFPVYFWLSGLIVVPAAPFIIGLGILLTLFHSFIPAWIEVPALLLESLIKGVNWLLLEIQHLPYSVISDIYLPDTSLLLIFCGLFLLAWIWEFSYWKYFPLLLLLLNVVAVARLYSEAKTYTEEKIVVYSASGETLVDYLFRGRLITIKSSTLPEEKEMKIAGAFRKRHRVQWVETITIPESGSRLTLGNFEGRIISSKEQPDQIPEKQPLDFILLCKNPPVLWSEKASARVLIADASNWRKTASSWKEASVQKGWNFVDVRETGAFQLVFRPRRFAFPLRLSETSREID